MLNSNAQRAEHDFEATLTHEVEHGDLLGDLDRVVQRQNHGGDLDANAFVGGERRRRTSGPAGRPACWWCSLMLM
jgi:hypothetical protein